MKLYKHQQRFLEKNPDRALLLWEMSCGKTLAACEWIKKRPYAPALVVCPKAIVGKWERDLEESGAIADVMTRDAIKEEDISRYGVLVLDEAHDFAAPLFNKQRSQRATKLYNHIKENPKTHVLLLTATPVRSTAWNIHTLACYLQHLWPVKEFRNTFEYMTDKFGRRHYELVSDWRKKVRPYVEEVADIVLLRDCHEIPTQKESVFIVPWTKAQEKALADKYLDSSAEWHERHRLENGKDKLLLLKELISGFRKVIVVCYYTAQIEQYAAEIARERQVYVLQGSTKNQDKVISEAQEADDCVFFVQASMGSGFDADSFSVMIFASQSFKFVDNVQAQGRILRLHNLHENTYIYLIGGKNDQKVFDTIKLGRDFHPPAYLKK